MRRDATSQKSAAQCGSGSDPRQRGSVIDVFCGAGGLSHGFLLEGFRVAKGIDIDESCRFPFEKNNHAPFAHRSIEDIDGAEINEHFVEGEPRILVGCAPCQPFSKYSQNRDDTRWSLLNDFARVIEESRPDIVSMENVPNLSTFKGGKVFDRFLCELRKIGYNFDWSVESCTNYGVPQSRSRLVLIATLAGEPPKLEQTHNAEEICTVRDAIGDLPKISSGGVHETDPLHRSSRLSSQNLDRIKVSNQGGTWHDWPQEMITDCHLRETGQSFTSVYGRMSWDKPSPTMTTQFMGYGNGRFGHPDQDRAISLREGALLQTFPNDYEFVPQGSKIVFKTLGRLIGNAVPVKFSRAIAKAISKHIGEYKL